MICEDISPFVLLLFVDSEELVLDRQWVAMPRLDGFCFLVAGFFIEANINLAKRVEAAH